MSNINLNQDMQTLEVGLKQAVFTGVLLHAGQNAKGKAIDYLAGTDTNVLEVTVPNGTKAIAQTILDGLKLRGYRYQPFNSERTITDPAIEIGDNVTANGTKAVVMGYDITHSRLMAPTLKAPYDEEVNHEFKFETRTQREYRRETAYTRSRLTINADAIVAEVARATEVEGDINATLTVHANEISARVTKSGGQSSSFGWSLTDSDWSLFSGGTTVLHATRDGIEVKGRITATSGYIGTESAGFEIGSRFIRNGMLNLTDTTNNGVYIGTDGIALGKGAFKVSSSGAVTASNLTITGGSINIGDKFRVDSAGNLTASSGTFTGNVYAKNIQYGGDYGTMGGGGITAGSIGTGTGSPLSSYAIGGIGGGVNFSSMESQAYYADWVCCYHLVCTGNISGTHYGLWADDGQTHSASWQTYTYPTGVSVSGRAYSYVWVKTSDGGTAQVPTAYTYSGSLTTGSGKLNYVGR